MVDTAAQLDDYGGELVDSAMGVFTLPYHEKPDYSQPGPCPKS